MLSQDLTNLATHMGELAINAPEKIGQSIDLIRSNIFSIASQVRQLEAHFMPVTYEEGETREHDHS